VERGVGGRGGAGDHSAAALEGVSSRKLVPTKKLRCPSVFFAKSSDSICAHSHTIDWQSERVERGEGKRPEGGGFWG